MLYRLTSGAVSLGAFFVLLCVLRERAIHHHILLSAGTFLAWVVVYIVCLALLDYIFYRLARTK